jgi:hypothetical protein
MKCLWDLGFSRRRVWRRLSSGLLRRVRWPIVLMMEAASISETSVIFYPTTRRNNPEDSLLHTRRRKNIKSHLVNLYGGGGGGNTSLRSEIRSPSLIALMMETASTSETSVNFYQTTRCNNQENSHRNNVCLWKPKYIVGKMPSYWTLTDGTNNYHRPVLSQLNTESHGAQHRYT